MFRKILITCILIFSFTGLLAQKPIYITLDVSPSMTGKKYDLANYSAQALAILNQDRAVILIVNSKLYPLSGNYQSIQKGMKVLSPSYQQSEIVDIRKLNGTIDSKIKGQDIFIIGDGIWGESEEIYNNFKKIYNTGNVTVTFLEILSRTSSVTKFEKFLEKEDIGKIYKVASTEDIISAVNSITEEITGVSAIPFTQLRIDGSCASFTSALKIKNFKIMYQDNKTLSQLPDIESIKINGKTVSFENIGEPSNGMFESKSGGLMSSRIYEVLDEVPAGTLIELCFSSNIRPENLRIYPITEVEMSNLSLRTDKGQATQIDDHTIGVCKENNSVELSFDYNSEDYTVPSELIQHAEIYFVTSKKRIKAEFIDDRFVATIPLSGNTTTYTIESELKGYFKYNSGQKKIVKTNDCKDPPPPPMQKVRKPPIHFGDITLDNLIREGKISTRIVDENTGEVLDPTQFDFKLSNNYKALFKSIRMEFRDEYWIDLYIEPRGDWCDCFIPDELKIATNFKPKAGDAINGKYYVETETDLIVGIIKEESWLSRCTWLLFSMIGSLLLAWLLILISRKNRFGRGTKIVFRYPDMSNRSTLNPKYITTDFQLRKKGLGAWFNRWFNPFVPEKNTLSFNNIDLIMGFIASKSIRSVSFPKASFNEENMQSVNFDPDRKDKYVKIDESSSIRIDHNKQYLGKTTNFLEYSFPKKSWNDIATFRFILGIIIAISFAYCIVAILLLIKSFF